MMPPRQTPQGLLIHAAHAFVMLKNTLHRFYCCFLPFPQGIVLAVECQARNLHCLWRETFEQLFVGVSLYFYKRNSQRHYACSAFVGCNYQSFFEVL